MATLARVLTFAVVLTLASANEQFGLFGCPDFRKRAVDIPYTNAASLNSYFTDLLSRFPLTLVAAAEREEAEQYSCIVLSSGQALLSLQFYKNGASSSKTVSLDRTAGVFKAVLPEGLLGVPDSTKERTWTVVSDEDGVIVMKTCRPGILSHFTSTYVFVDKSVDAAFVDMRCLIPVLDKSLCISSKPKGVCLSEDNKTSL